MAAETELITVYIMKDNYYPNMKHIYKLDKTSLTQKALIISYIKRSFLLH